MWLCCETNGVYRCLHCTIHWWIILKTGPDCPRVLLSYTGLFISNHDDVIKWNHFPRYWPFVRGIHRYAVNSPHKGQWRGALMFSLICVWINGWVSNREAGDLRRYRAHYDVTVMYQNWLCGSCGYTQTSSPQIRRSGIVGSYMNNKKYAKRPKK